MPCEPLWVQVNPGKFGTGLALRKIGVHTHAMAPTPYADVIARNIRAARSRADIGQESLAARMRALGYEAWIRQTVGSTERGRRRPTAEEILGLAYALQTTIGALMAPRDEDKTVDFPSGEPIPVRSVQLSAQGQILDAVWWDDDKPVFPRGKDASPHFDAVLDVASRMRAGAWPPDEEG